ncbi:galactose-1-phosphate uridylyltransferase [Streptomyces afghaniensis]|uniref:galactose-1-phosphate uridylyltransferase n=1 Tax=Streptomyces afghaniensis TaxID=66865 RepID=UPI0037D7E21D
MTTAAVRRRHASLADGRSVYLYDERAQPLPVSPDARCLSPGDRRAELRWDPTLAEWVVVAPHRAVRPKTSDHTGCPLCPSTPTVPSEIPCADYDVVVFENRFPALSGRFSAGAAEAAQPTRPAAGRCEVVVFSSAHDLSLARLSTRRVRTVIEAWVDRTKCLNAVAGVEQVVCFENRGTQIGATLTHPHGQIYAYPFIPARFERMLLVARGARDRGDRCVHCQLVESELQSAERVIGVTRHWIAFVPPAARWPYEARLYARRHVPDLAALDADELDDLAEAYRSLLRRFETVATAPLPYMALWVQAAAGESRDLTHLHAQVFSDRSATGVKRLAAGELGAGAWVTEVCPEAMAERLRGAPPAHGHDSSASDVVRGRNAALSISPCQPGQPPQIP